MLRNWKTIPATCHPESHVLMLTLKMSCIDMALPVAVRADVFWDLASWDGGPRAEKVLRRGQGAPPRMP